MSDEKSYEEMVRLLPDTVTLKRNAKKEYSWEIKIRFPENTPPAKKAEMVAKVNGDIIRILGLGE
jgi:hypothetical protein